MTRRSPSRQDLTNSPNPPTGGSELASCADTVANQWAGLGQVRLPTRPGTCPRKGRSGGQKGGTGPVGQVGQVEAGERGLSATSPALALRAPAAAAALGISPRLLWSLTNQGKVPHLRLGRSVVYPVDMLQRWLAEQANGGDQA